MTIKAFGLTYGVVVDGTTLRSRGYASASIDPIKQIITLHPERSAEAHRTDLLHEIIEIVSQEQALDLKEPVIRRLETGLRIVFLENGWVLPIAKEGATEDAWEEGHASGAGAPGGTSKAMKTLRCDWCGFMDRTDSKVSAWEIPVHTAAGPAVEILDLCEDCIRPVIEAVEHVRAKRKIRCWMISF